MALLLFVPTHPVDGWVVRQTQSGASGLLHAATTYPRRGAFATSNGQAMMGSAIDLDFSCTASIGNHPLLLSVDASASASNGVSNIGLGVAFLLVLAAGLFAYLTQSVVPEQMNALALLVRDKEPERWEELLSQLAPGERMRDRSDLMAELTTVGLQLMKKESEVDMKRLLAFLRQKGEERSGQPDEDENTIGDRGAIEDMLGCPIVDFVDKVERNADSLYLTDTRRELADLLKQEFIINSK